MIPTKIGRYEIKSELGRGGMAVVYHAYDPSFDREVAIKVLPKEFLHDPNFQERFKREIKIIAALEHPAIVPVYDLGEEDGSPYFVMRYMPGGSLTGRINQGKFSLQDAAKVIEKVASGIAYAHQKEIVHRDLKPDNILFDANGDPYISDFGVASFSSNNENLTGAAAIGTPAYMSPEQAQGDKVDSRSDIYGLGVIIFQMLSGQQPYKAETPMGVALKQITDPVPDILKDNPELSAETDTIIRTAMAKKKEDRYSSATDLARAVDQAAKLGTDPAGIAAQRSASLEASAANNKRSLIMIAGGVFVGGGILLAIIAAVVFRFAFSTENVTAVPAEITAPAVVSTDQPTVAPTPTPDRKFFTEDFDGDVSDSWKHFIIGGDEDLITSSVQDGFMGFNVSKKEMNYYTYYTSATYDNVRIDVRAENRGKTNSIVLIMCRFTEGKDWYEFQIDSGGLYRIMYTSFNKDKINTSSSTIINGGSNLIIAGKATNEYSATCNDRTLSLSINGEEVKSVVDDKYTLTGGNVGIGAASGKVPAEVGVDSVSINEP